MTRRNQNQMVGRNPWDVEAAYWIIKVGLRPAQAQAFTIIRWMRNGDLRPLAAAIVEGHSSALHSLAQSIIDNPLTVKPLRRGRPKAPIKSARDLIATLSCKSHSENAFKQVADCLGISEQSVRQAVKAHDKQLPGRYAPHFDLGLDEASG
jgi:hypothetical protein